MKKSSKNSETMSPAFRGFFKTIGAKGPCYVNFEGDPGDGWARIALPDKSDYDWTEVTGEVTVKPPRGKRKPGPDGKIRIYVFIYTRAYGELWIDDVTLTPVAAPATEDAKKKETP